MSSLFEFFSEMTAPLKALFEQHVRPVAKEKLDEFLEPHPAITQKEFQIQQKVLQGLKEKVLLLQQKVNYLEKQLSQD